MQRPELYCLMAVRAIARSAVVPLAALVLAAMTSAARAETPLGCATPPTNELVAYRCKFYDGEIADVVARAREWIKWRAPYAHNPALVLDIDETSYRIGRSSTKINSSSFPPARATFARA